MHQPCHNATSYPVLSLNKANNQPSNSADLSLIRQMGVKPPRNVRDVVPPLQKLRAAIHVVIATKRMQRHAADWARMKKLGEGLRRAKNELAMRRGRESAGPVVGEKRRR